MGPMKPTAGRLAFLAVLMWVLSWWLLGVAEDVVAFLVGAGDSPRSY